MLTITSPYGPRRITVNGKAMHWPHRGVDVRSPRGAAVRALFGGRVVKTASGRTSGAPIGRTDPDTGAAALASSVSGNGVIIGRDGGGCYVEVHLDPAVRVGDRVEVGDLIGHTDLSGQVSGAHRHIELWRRFDPDSHYNPTAEVRAAASGKASAPAPEPARPNIEEDDLPYSKDELIQAAAEGVVRALGGKIAPDALRTIVTEGAWGAQVGSGESRRTLATALVNAEAAAKAARAESAALRSVLAQTAGGGSVDYDRIDQIVREAVASGIDVTVTVPSKEN